MRNNVTVTDKLLQMVGVNLDVMDVTPHCRKRWVSLAVMTLAAAALVATGVTVMFAVGFDLPAWALPFVWAIAFGFFLAFEMLMLRTIDVPRHATVWMIMKRVWLRVVLSALVSYVTATFVVMVLFSGEINAQAQIDRSEAAADYSKKTLAPLKKELETKETALRKAQDKEAGRSQDAVSTNPDVVAAEAAVAAKAKEVSDAEIDAACEAQGAGGCQTGTATSDKAGCGPICQGKKDRAARLRDELRSLESKRDAIRTEAQKKIDESRSADQRAGKNETERLSPEVETLQKRVADAQKEYDKASDGSIGMAAKMEAAHNLIGKNLGSIGILYVVLELILVGFELTPLFSKIGLLRRGDAYLDQLEREEAIEDDRLANQAEIVKLQIERERIAKQRTIDAEIDQWVDSQSRLRAYALSKYEADEMAAIDADYRGWLGLP